MLTKFETKSNRVKGLAFHPKRPWILASLHSGVVQLWDYRMGTLIDRFAEHDGPVRGVEFHSTQPIFVSGGDDYKVKVWSYKTRRCLFTLTGHLDYIRTVQFHPEHPWIVSASDDQTVRIWNWQSRTCMSVLTGHNHYVMCASFHPKEDLVVSASLDQTVRVWDISGLRKKSVAPGSQEESTMNADLFGSGDAVVKYVLEGHERGVNWAAFHPSLPLIVSGADDRLIKLWRMNDSKAWEVDSLRGHMNNVSCVMFSPRQDVIISNSEDRTIRVWDLSRRAAVQTFRREHDRFWILAAHPEVTLLAAGHDSGMLVFKLARERPPHSLHGSSLYFVSDRSLRLHDLETGRGTLLLSLRKPAAWSPKATVVRSVSYNPAEHAVLINTDEDGGTFKLFTLPGGAGAAPVSRGEVAETASGSGSSAVFIARNRYAVLDRAAGVIQIRNLQNEITKKCPPPDATCSALYYAGTGTLLCRCEERVALFDVQQRSVTAETPAAGVKYVAWDEKMQRVALLAKHAITLLDARLERAVTVHETIRVKSAAWSGSGVLVYTTLNHIKYALWPSGDSGIVRTLDAPIYVVAVAGDTVHALDREGKARTIQIDPSEYLFKRALAARDYDAVLRIIRSGKLCGQALIAFLRRKGFPEVALHFAEDDRTRFALAIECGNIEVALATAQRLDDKALIHQLGNEAFRHGNVEMVEGCWQQTKAFEKLSFLYAVTGNTEKLGKMAKIAELRGDVMSRYQNALFLGSARMRVKVLADAGLTALAYVAAKTHGLEEEAAALADALGGKLPELPSATNGAAPGLLMPPTPLLRAGNWPLLAVSTSVFAGKLAEGGGGGGGAGAVVGGLASAAAELDLAGADDGGWGDDLGLPGEGGGEGPGGGVDARASGAGGLGGDGGDDEDGWDMEDLELPADLPVEASAPGAFVAPPLGQPVTQRWAASCKLVAELAAAGSFAAATRMLRHQLGITEFEPLKAGMLGAHAAAFVCVAGIPGLPAVSSGIEARWSKERATAPPAAPTTPFRLAALEALLAAAYKMFNEQRLEEALEAFNGILLKIPLLVVATRKEVDDVKELLAIATEYHTAIRCELHRRQVAEAEPLRAVELAAYLTHSKLQKLHQSFMLRAAMGAAFKAKLLATCAGFARRVLELSPPEKVGLKARQVLAVCEKSPVDASAIAYDARNPFDLCAKTFVPIYRGSPSVACPYTKAKFVPECAGEVCPVGGLTRIGGEAGSGLVCSHTQRR